MNGATLRGILKGSNKPMGEIATALGMTAQNLNNHLRKDEVPEWLMLMIREKLKINIPNRTITFIEDDGRKGEVRESEPVYEATPLNMDSVKVMNVPLVSERAQAGYLRGYADPEFIEQLEKIPWIVDREYKGNYLSFTVRGDSMDDGSRDSYVAGDKLLCREVAQHLWQASRLHINKWDFVIVHRKDGVVIKRIVEHDTKRNTIKLHSLNPQYDDYEVHLKDVLKIFNVVQVLRRKV